MIYLVFGSVTDSAKGGWRDFQGAYPTLSDAQAAIPRNHAELSWYHIIRFEYSKEEGEYLSAFCESS